jgi:AcrR family transcriptional regulator
MPRTLDPIAHAGRRDAFVDAGIGLIQEKGYGSLSIGEVIDAVGASKGAFYHYFGSKAELLDAVVVRMVGLASQSVEPVVADPRLTAVQKFEGVFAGLARWKGVRRDLILAVLQVWFSEENTVVREHMRETTERRFTPLLADIVRQGIGEGSFSVHSPESAAGVLVALILAANETMSRLLLAHRAGSVSFTEVSATLAAYGEAFERILGLPAGSLDIFNRRMVGEWFTREEEHPR